MRRTAGRGGGAGGCSDVRAALLHCVHEAVHRDVKGVRYADHSLATPLLCVCVCVCVWCSLFMCVYVCFCVCDAFWIYVCCGCRDMRCVLCVVLCASSRTYRQQMQDDIEGPNDVRPHLRRE